MVMELFGHLFSSYTWKALIAFYENDIPFAFRALGPDQPENGARFAELWPIGKFPMLVDGGRTVMESSTIIEHLQLHHPGPVRLIPESPEQAIEVRMLDRISDNYVMGNMQRVVANALRPPQRRDPVEVDLAKAALETAYRWLDGWLGGREWAASGRFSMADCAFGPALFYADWVHRIPDELANVKAYRARLLARPSISRCVEEARPYRPLFPLGAPDRD
jgi:glutathione S-transferase